MPENAHLVYCPICENGCSSAAAACPQCGHPIAVPQARPATPAVQYIPQAQPIQTIQQTGKGYKLAKLIGAVLMVWGTVVIGVGVFGEDQELSVGGTVAVFVGLCVVAGARFGTWWDHE